MHNENRVFILSLIGALFSGYLTYQTYVKGVCAFGETCPYVLGLPACVYGLVLFSVLVAISFLLINTSFSKKLLVRCTQVVALIGLLFSATLSFKELFFTHCGLTGCAFALFVPTCVYGAIMYALILFYARLE